MATIPNIIHRIADRMHLHRHDPEAAPAENAAPHAAESKPHHKDGYVSEFTDFMDHFLDDHPEVVRDQHRGWYIWWNRKVDFRDLVRASRDTVPTAGYYYFDNPPTTTAPGSESSGGPSPSGKDQRH